jgi:NAD(P)-dependent dehydrogenase (short-subunit alcohol dehydrogenase family)
MVASMTGPVMAMRGEAAYAAAKAGMVGLTRSVAAAIAFLCSPGAIYVTGQCLVV